MRWTITQLRTLAASLVLCTALACAGGMTFGVVYAERRPPPVRVEVITHSPGRGYVWMPGYWRWDDGEYFWVSGHWARVRHGYSHWVPGHWRERHHRWYWQEGHWAR